MLEKIWMQVFEEAGGTLVPNEKLRNMRIGVDVEDKRFFFRDQFAHCPWVHVSQAGEQCENGDLVFCLPYGLWLPSFSWLP